MRKTGYKVRHIRYLSYMMAAVIGLMPPYTVMAVEKTEETAEDSNGTTDVEEYTTDNDSDIDRGKITTSGDADVATEVDGSDKSDDSQMKYILAFEELPEEDAYFSCMYKPALEELLDAFPETLSVYVEEEENVSELEIAWECEEDFEDTDSAYYVFYPRWDETQYVIADSVKDSVEIPFIVVEVPSDGGIIKDLEQAKSSLQEILKKKSILALVYLCDEYDLKQSASEESDTVHTVVCGQSVQITDVDLDEYGAVWYQVLLYQNESEYTGYVQKEYLATSDEDFAEWEETHLDFSAVPMVMSVSEGCPDVDQFPASYQNALYALKEKHPNWTFVRMNTGLDWNSVIKSELGDRSLVPSSSSGSWQNGTYGQGWSYASEGILKYYMDPRNFLTDPSIFQFEQLTYNDSYHTTDAVQEIIKNSFMSSAIPGDSQTYAQAFVRIGESVGVSPFHLASRVLQEQGTKGTSLLISGTYPGYEGYYNYFNVGASGKTDAAVVTSGLKTAVSYGWNTRYKSLYGGSSIVGANYILRGQDTLYLEKFNVSNGQYANFTHQYMQNIQAPNSEASNIRKAYYNAGALENSFVFKIPVFDNMPASACSKPEVTDVITLNKTTVDSLEVDRTVTLIPYVNDSKLDNVDNMTFASSNSAVAIVDDQGKITGVSPGTATISCTRSGANTASCTVTVVKATPGISTPALSPVVYQQGLKLSDISLPDGWKWENDNTEISVGTVTCSAIYTPADTVKYNTVSKEISFTVTKAIPSCQIPEKLEAQVGSVLGNVALPNGFVWESNIETELTKAGEYTFYVSYNPDENTYYTVSHIPVILRVIGDRSEPSEEGNSFGGSTSSGSSATSAGSTGTGSTSSRSSATSTGSTGTGSTSSGSSATSTGSTGTGSTSSGSSAIPTGSTGTGSTLSGSSATSTGSTGTGSTSSGSSATSTESTQTDSTGTSGGNSSTLATNESAQSQAVMSPPGGNSQSESVATGSTASQTVPTESAQSESAQTANVQDESVSTGSMSNESVPTESAPDVNDATGNAAGGIVPGGNNGAGSASNGNASAESVAGATDIPGNERVDMSEPAEEEIIYKPSVMIQMDDTTILTAETLRMAKEQNFNLLLDMGDDASWSIDIDLVDAEAFTAIDMGIRLGTTVIPQELIEDIRNGNKYIELTLAHDGTYGFNPILRVVLNPADCGRYANLFYYDPETEALAFVCDSIIDAGGTATFYMDHASSYVIIVSDQSMADLLFATDPETSMAKWIILGVFLFMLLVVIGYAVIFFRKKKREGYDNDADEDDGEDYDEAEEEEGYLDEDEFDEMEIEEIKDEEQYAAVKRKSGKKKTERKEPASRTGELRPQMSETKESQLQESEIEESNEEDDWIEDGDWEEPGASTEKTTGRYADDHAENDWIEDDEWDIGNDWMEDEEWERKNGRNDKES